MKLSIVVRTLVCAAFATLASVSTWAHTGLETATPADGATVTEAPGHINLVFNGPVKLVKFEVMGVGHEMPTKFEVGSEAMAAYTIETPGMHPGAFTVNWAVIGADGHTVANSYGFVVDPSAAETRGAAHSHDGDAGHSHDGDAGHGQDAAAGHGQGGVNPH